MSARVIVPGAALLAALLGLAGCYTKDVSYKPFMTGLDGAQMNSPPVVSSSPPGGDPAAAPDNTIVVENDDGSVTLVTRNAQHLMRHIERTLEKEEKDLFTAQVLSARTRAEYLQRGKDAGEAFDTLKKREKDIRELFRRMPLGEHSPNVIMKKLGPELYRVKLTGAATRDLWWTNFDMEMEGGQMVMLEKAGQPVMDAKTGRQVEVMTAKNWKLVWFGRF